MNLRVHFNRNIRSPVACITILRRISLGLKPDGNQLLRYAKLVRIYLHLNPLCDKR